jgi:hypothetical protein
VAKYDVLLRPGVASVRKLMYHYMEWVPATAPTDNSPGTPAHWEQRQQEYLRFDVVPPGAPMMSMQPQQMMMQPQMMQPQMMQQQPMMMQQQPVMMQQQPQMMAPQQYAPQQPQYAQQPMQPQYAQQAPPPQMSYAPQPGIVHMNPINSPDAQ